MCGKLWEFALAATLMGWAWRGAVLRAVKISELINQ